MKLSAKFKLNIRIYKQKLEDSLKWMKNSS